MSNSRLAFRVIRRAAWINGVVLVGVLFAYEWMDYRSFIFALTQELTAEVKNATEIVRDNYTNGDLLAIRRYMNALSDRNNWVSGTLRDAAGDVLWSRVSERSIESPKFVFRILSVFSKEGDPKLDRGLIHQSANITFENGSSIGHMEIAKAVSSDFARYLRSNIRVLAILFVVASVLFLIELTIIRKTLLPMSSILHDLEQEAKVIGVVLPNPKTYDELETIRNWFRSISDSWLSEKQSAIQREKDLAIVTLAAQVAHDIRSPLAALAAIEKDIAVLPEDTRVLIRSAVNRIKDIANNLLEKNRQGATTSLRTESSRVVIPSAPTSPQLLSGLLDRLITEKRLQFRSKIGIVVELHFNRDAYGLFAKVQDSEFNRVLSNLINNSVEALGNSGRVDVSLVAKDDGRGDGSGQIEIRVRDNGKGISTELLPKLMQKGATFGKSEGSGLGLFHARNSIESWGGSMRIESDTKPGPMQGTTVIIALPRVPAPAWFVPKLMIEPNSVVAILDDDPSIHQIWQGRFESLQATKHGVSLVHFSTPDEIKRWVMSEAPAAPTVFLVDYELIGQAKNGLDVIELLGIQKESILVTSRFEERSIRERCEKLGVPLIPKGLAGFVPIAVGN